MTVTGGTAAPSISWTARVPRELAEQVEAAMPLLGLTNRSQVVVAALRMLRKHARETEILAAVDAEYGPGAVVPAGAVTAGLENLLTAEDAPNVSGGDESPRRSAPTR